MSCTFSKDNIAVQNPEIINDLMQRLSKVSFLQAAYKIYTYILSFVFFWRIYGATICLRFYLTFSIDFEGCL